MIARSSTTAPGRPSATASRRGSHVRRTRQVRVIDFERAFAIPSPDQRTPLLLLYRDQLAPSHVAGILGCSPQLPQYHANRALARLTDALDRLHLL